MRGFNYKKAVQALNYLAQKSGGTINKMKAIKLVWLSDRLHLRKFGRSITGDEYYALQNGPVPSATRDVLESSDFLDDAASDYASDFIAAVDKYNYKSLTVSNLKVFSKTDLDVLDTVYNSFSHLNHFELSDFSHLFPEWKKYESALNNRLSSRFPINQFDFFLNLEEKSGLFNDSEEILEISKRIFEENSNLLTVL